jgi:molybdopterin-guanine dinucleotide biosynthesis protein A
VKDLLSRKYIPYAFPAGLGMKSTHFLLHSTAGFVLAGGRSSRMGTDKALAQLAGQPLIQIALEIMAAAGLSARIAGSRTNLATYAQEIPDTSLDSGPLSGIHAALSVSAAELNLFLPVDLPLMPASLLACLLQRAALTGQPVTATRLSGRLEPFPVVLHRSVLPQIGFLLATGATACHQAWQSIPRALEGQPDAQLDAIPVESLVQCGQCAHLAHLPPVLWYQSANTPADLERLTRICAKLPSSIPRRSSNLRA